MSLIKWTEINREEVLEEMLERAEKQPVMLLLFRHNDTFSTKAMAQLEADWDSEAVADIWPYIIYLPNHEGLARQVAERFDVPYDAPILLLIDKGEKQFAATGREITYTRLERYANM